MPCSTSCILCGTTAKIFYQGDYRSYFTCDVCKAVFMSPRQYLSPQEEKARYELHENDVDDPGYRKFVAPLVEEVKARHPKGACGLDYGAGTGPVAAKILGDAGYEITTYDPFFEVNEMALQATYDFIICSEVAEHFHHPKKEFERLKKLLRPDGLLLCMTLRYDPAIDFGDWHYKNDETHVIFYQAATAHWLKEKIEFSGLTLKDRLMIFER